MDNSPSELIAKAPDWLLDYNKMYDALYKVLGKMEACGEWDAVKDIHDFVSDVYSDTPTPASLAAAMNATPAPCKSHGELKVAEQWADKVIASPECHNRTWDWNTDVTLLLAKGLKAAIANNAASQKVEPCRDSVALVQKLGDLPLDREWPRKYAEAVEGYAQRVAEEAAADMRERAAQAADKSPGNNSAARNIRALHTKSGVK